MSLISTNDAEPADPATRDTWSWQLPDDPVSEPADPDTGGTWSWQPPDDPVSEPADPDTGGTWSWPLPDDPVSEPADPDTGLAPDRRKSRKWLALALALAVVTLLNLAALTTGALYAVSIDRAINDNLRHKSDQLPAGRKGAPDEELS